ncbi:uncharacterized protein LOC134252762 [Saccostrea cucullata]|uniref:uncharacterized protein LOC134252762 n=1 Tax=Saccostrea cuccullata TaxID=36930 RepID=UPI002ED1A120
MKTTEILTKEFEVSNRLYCLAECKSPLEKIIRCVVEITTGGQFVDEMYLRKRRKKIKNFEIIRLLKLAPRVVTTFSKYDMKGLFEKVVSEEEIRILRDTTVMMNLSDQPNNINFPPGTTLLHLGSCTGNVEFVKMILQAPLAVNVDAKTSNGVRALDLAVIYGSWDIYKLLVGHNAKFTVDTIVACCSDERFKQVEIWTRKIRYLCSSEKPSPKAKKKILMDLYERNKIDLNFFSQEIGGPLYNAIDCHLDEIVLYLVDTNPSLLVRALNSNTDIVAQLQKCKEGTVAHVYTALISHFGKLETKTLGQLLLQTAVSLKVHLTETLTRTFYRILDQEQWEEAVEEVDKHGRSIFHFVAIFGWETIARILSEVVHRENLPGFPLNKADYAGASPLWYALAHKHWKIARLFLLNGANPILQRAVPGCFIKRPKPAEINDVCFHECEDSHSLISKHGIKMSARRKVKLTDNKDSSVGVLLNGMKSSILESKNDQQQIEKSGTKKAVCQPNYRAILINKEQKMTEYLFKKAHLSRTSGFSLIHFASGVGDLKLFEEILSISENKLKVNDDYMNMGYRCAILGNQRSICDIYHKNSIHLSDNQTFHSIVWQALRTETVQRNVFHFLFSLLGFVYDNTLTSGKTPLLRYQTVPKYHGFSYKHEGFKFADFLTKLCENLSEQGVEKNLIDQLKTKVQYIYGKIQNYLKEKLHFIAQQTSEKNPQLEIILTNFLKTVDANTRIDENDILLLLSTTQPWVISSLIAASKTNKYLSKLLRKQLLWNLNILDCIVISLPKDYGRSDAVFLHQQDISDEVSALADQFGLILQETTIHFACNKSLWTFLRIVASKVIPREKELKVCWQLSLAQAVREGQLDFLKSILDNISISKLPETVQASFAALLCKAAFYGQTDIVKYLFRKSVPIRFDTENPMFVDLLDKIYVKNFDVIEYAIRSKRPETVDTVIKFCKYDREFMKAAKPESYFELAASTGDWPIMKYFTEIFSKHGRPTKQTWERFFIGAASKGQEDFCAQILTNFKDVDVLCVDKRNKHALHYCGIYNMKRVAQFVLDKTTRGFDVSDSDGMRPIDYAVLLGNIEVVQLFNETKFMHSKENIDRVETYGWFHFFMSKVNSSSTIMSDVDIRPYLPKSRQLDLTSLYKKGDDNAAAAVVSCSKHIPKLILENPTTYGFLLHDSIKYGCKKAFHALMAYFVEEAENRRQVLKLKVGDMCPLAVAVSNAQLEIAEYIFQYDDGLSWKSTKSAENILHLAIHTEDPEMIELVSSKTVGRLCEGKDIYGFTPVMYMSALGLQDYYSLLKSDALLNPWGDSHAGHTDDDPDMTCHNCLLNKCIGWSKIYNRSPLDKDIQSMRSENNALPPPLLTEYFWKLGKYRSDNPIISAIMVSSGYNATMTSLIRLVTRKEGIEKMISMEGIEKTLEDFQNSNTILENILAMSITANNEKVFVALLDLASGLNNTMKKNYGTSIFEAVIGLSRLDLLVHLKKALNCQEDDFSTFKEIQSTLPQKQLWLSELDNLGGKQWPRFELSPERHDPRILKSDLWLVQSVKFPESIRKELETKCTKENIIATEFSNLKYTVDFDSFRKIADFGNLSDVWIQCFLTSSIVLDHIEEIKINEATKSTPVKSVKVVCLTSGTTDHPKVTMDNTGAVLNQIRVSMDKGSLFVRLDKSCCQRQEEIHLKEDVQENVIPYFEEFMQKEFRLKIKVKVDWNSIELRRRTYNTEVVMKSLNGDIYGNRLGGLEDTLNECRDMKNDIESMFDKETAENVLRDFSNITEIIVSLEDKMTSEQTGFMSGQNHVNSKVNWKFTITRSRLYYDRSQFPLWQNLTMYRSVCGSLCHSVYCISKINGTEDNENANSTKRCIEPVTFEVDLQSFGINDLSILRTLMCRDVGRELIAIAYDCKSMLRLKYTSKRLLLKNTISLQHTGVSIQEDTATVFVCCNETDNKEWIVERSNSFSRLSDAEDKQLLVGWPAESSDKLNQIIINVQDEVKKKVGIAITFQADEKRLIPACLLKFRRELSHPHDLLRRSLEASYTEYKNVYIRILHDLLLSQKYPVIKQNPVEQGLSGVWVKIKQNKGKSGQLVLTKKLAEKELLSALERPKYVKLPFLEKECFEMITESTKVIEHPEVWKHEIITEKNQADFKHFVVLHQGNIYTFSDSDFYKKCIQELPLRVVISQDTAHALETGYLDFLYDKLMDNITEVDLPSIETFQLHVRVKQEIKKMINIENIDIQWRSFVFKKDPGCHQLFADCINAVVDSFQEIFAAIPECIVSQRILLEMHSMFTGVSGLRIAMRENINTKDDEDVERTILDEKKPGVMIRILSGNILEIIFRQKVKITKFSELLYSASAQLAEIKIKSLLGCKRSKQKPSVEVEEQKERPKPIIRPSYDKVMLHLGDMIFAVSSICSSIKSFMTVVPEEVDDFYFVTSTRKTGFTLKNKTLMYNISKENVNPGQLAEQLLEEFEFQGLKKSLVILDLNVTAPSVHDKNKNILMVTLAINNYNKDVDTPNSYKLRNANDYNVILQGHSENLKVSRVEQKEEHLVLTIPLPDKVKIYTKQGVIVQHNYIRQENCKSLIFDSNKFLKHEYPKEMNEKITVKKNASLKFLLEHNTVLKENGHKPERHTNEGKHEVVLHSPEVKFTFYFQKKHFPSSTSTMPFTLGTWAWSSALLWKVPRNGPYSLLVNDSQRGFRVRAQCLRCKQFLNIITHLGKTDAGVDLEVNYKES